MKFACTRITIAVTVLSVLVLSGEDASAQPFRNNWIGTSGVASAWDAGDAGGGEGTNWELDGSPGVNFQPDGANGILEYGSISNGGIAVISSAIGPSPLDIILAQDGQSTGGLIIQDGGAITVQDQDFEGTNYGDGDLRNGTNGVGTVTLHDAIGNVTVAGYEQNAQSTLNLEIGGTTFNPVTVTNNVNLNGILQINSSALASAPVGTSWTIFDGSADGAAINGQFNEVINNTNRVLLPGQSFNVATGGSQVKVEIQQQLVLRVDAYEGTAVLENPAGSGVSFDLTGYELTVNDGSVDTGQWVSFLDDGQAGFVEGSSANQVGETNATGQVTLGDGASKDFGAPLVVNTDQPIGTNIVDGNVSLRFSTPDNTILDAVVISEGRANNLVLVVDPEDGGAVLQNQSIHDIDLTGYVVESLSGALLPSYSDLEGQGVLGWENVVAASTALAELNAENASMLSAGDTLDLGSLWNLSEEDLSLEFSLAGTDAPINGLVVYGDPIDIGGEEILGDYNDNGTVEQGDLDLVLLNWGDDVPPTPPGWVNQIPTDGKIDQNDLDGVLLNWGNTAAVASAAAVPEPGCLGLIGLAMAGCLVLRSRGRQS